MERHVLMLVNNPCVNDSRVIKSAEALAKEGWQVTVLCRHEEGIPESESRNGVDYRRVESMPVSVSAINALLLSNLTWPSLKARATAVLPRLWTSSHRETNVKQVQDKARGYTRLSRESHREALRRFALALSVLARGSWSVGMHVYRQLRRPFSAYGKPVLSRALRVVWLGVRPFLTILFKFFDTDEFGLAAVRRSKSMQPDVVHAHDLSTLPAGGRIARATGARLIYDSHELEMHRNATYAPLVKWRRQRLERKYIRRADAVITVSNSIADHLRDVYCIERPRVVMNSPLFEELHKPQHDVRSELGLSNEVPLAVYVGSVTINRGLEQTVRALAHAPAVHLATVGPRRPATEQDLRRIGRDSGVLDRVHFVDPVAPDEVVGYIRSADVSILPIQNVCLSYYYCMPNKLLESVFAGVPVAVADLVEMRRFVERYECGVIMDETDPGAIARTLVDVISKRDAFVLSAKKRRLLADQYGWQKQAEKLRELYDELFESELAAVKIA